MEGFEQEEIGRLIARYLAQEASEEESARLRYWLQDSAENRLYFHQVRNIWDASQKNTRLEEIDATAALNSIIKRISAKQNKNILWKQWQKVAAILMIPMLAGNILWFLVTKNNAGNSTPVYNEVYAAFGTRSALKLADGTQVWLNSGSRLKYPDRFKGKKREVFLSGEAYFEVMSDPSKPFVVTTSSLVITATGTIFNIKDYDSKPGAETILVSGKVSVGRKSEYIKNEILSRLNPGERLLFEKQTQRFTIDQVDTYKYTAWKDGKLIFRNDPLRNVVERISQIYNVDIELQGDALQDYRYRATFQDESLEEILRLLALSSPVNYVELKRVPLADGTFPRKKIIIYPAKKTVK